MTRIILTLIAALLTSHGTTVMAQNAIGQSQFDGETIILNDDFTWSYAEQSANADNADCFKITSLYNFCGRPLGWVVTSKLSPEAVGSFRLDDRNYAIVIQEALGADDGFTLDFMQEAIITNFTTAAGIGKQDVTTYETLDFELFGSPARRVVYGGRISGLDVIYYNTIWLSERETIQFLSFTISNEPTDAAKELHLGSVDALRSAK